jgi:hypothetical protein
LTEVKKVLCQATTREQFAFTDVAIPNHEEDAPSVPEPAFHNVCGGCRRGETALWASEVVAFRHAGRPSAPSCSSAGRFARLVV